VNESAATVSDQVNPVDAPLDLTPEAFRWWLAGCVAGVCAAFTALLMLAPGPDLVTILREPAMLILIVLVLLADLYPLVPWMRESNPFDEFILSTPLSLAAMLVFGPRAAVVFLLAGAAMTIAMRMVWWRVVLNISLWGIQGAAAAGALVLITGSFDWSAPIPVWLMLPISGVLALAIETLNVVLVGASLTLVGAITWAEHLADWRRQITIGSLALTAPIPAVLALHAPGLLPLLAPAMVAAQSGLRAVASRTTQAGADPLTAVANRATLLARMRHRMSRPGGAKDPVTLLLVDVDSFKQVNDAHGHLAGDRVLVEVARRLEEATRSTDLVARFGGDEFAILLGADATATRTAEAVADRIRRAVAGPIVIGQQTVVVGVSVGSAVGNGDARELLAAADAQLYRAKAVRPAPGPATAGRAPVAPAGPGSVADTDWDSPVVSVTRPPESGVISAV